jgi:hypothetical protein
MVVGLAISMIAVLGVGIISLSNKNVITDIPNQDTNEDA